MANQIHPHFMPKKDFLTSYPTLYYGTDQKWLAVLTPDQKICALALKTFPGAENLLKRYHKHTIVKSEIHLPQPLSCLLVGTPLQHQVWMALLDIPYGETWSYQQLAIYINKPKAVRAVANAVGANPISPLIPCHRVIRSNHKIGGYYWGIGAKRQLLKEEGVEI
ncbi:MAG: MGMT family protein [Alphaproteobacteria bacterium]|jgi:O-6-methylguanine DNA methyltransferase|nr:MGMT family protein [Alphaproteobacteria bacterium]MBP9777325.1 MGMT family protein [Alphaproteobacteria bacterium]